ncbi:hypothetical protein Sango_1554300 [Sesamum angolense]|uniref:Integrase zinc-binding domain-containing protein n=1 Tax=Sesamum angolense TaxID=2727404 RepID=A0AAE1WPD4_9LAMI|nr:hypothetical protein Sango_1554300 [Sesamum angolense]
MLLGYDYTLTYKKGQYNTVTDTVLRNPHSSLIENGSLHYLSWCGDDRVQNIIQLKEQDPTAEPQYAWRNGVLMRKGRLLVGKDDHCRKLLLQLFHASVLGGHSVLNTLQRMKKVVYWKGMKQDIFHFVKDCLTCQMHKLENVASLGLLQPLPIPGRICEDISMDFISGLPQSLGKDTVLVAVDCLSKSLQHRETTIRLLKENMRKAKKCMKT